MTKFSAGHGGGEVVIFLGVFLIASLVITVFLLRRVAELTGENDAQRVFIDRREVYHVAEVNRLNDEMFRLANRYKIVCDELEYFSLAKLRKAPVLKIVKKDGDK